MKIHLQWSEKFEVTRNFPVFELDSQEFPQLELEIQRIHEAARDPQELEKALDNLEYKMHHTHVAGSMENESTGRGETIMDLVSPSPWNQRTEEEGEPVGGFNFVGTGVK